MKRLSTLERHVAHADHKSTLMADSTQTEFQQVLKKARERRGCGSWTGLRRSFFLWINTKVSWLCPNICQLFYEQGFRCAQIQVEHCLSDLVKLKEGKLGWATYLDELGKLVEQDDNRKPVFKGDHALKGSNNITSIKNSFIDKLIENLEQGFPKHESNVSYASALLGIRPISFLSSEELTEWGIRNLLLHFGMEKEHKYANGVSKAQAIVNPEAAKEEWSKLKPLLVNAGYPRDKMVTLWNLIHKYHSEEFLNLLTLASLALTAPIHTADCERGFSTQSNLKTAQQNQLSPERMDDLICIASKGDEFALALNHWWVKKARHIFNAN